MMYIYIYMGVSKNRGTPQIINFNMGFHYKPSILGYPYFWKHPYILIYATALGGNPPHFMVYPPSCGVGGGGSFGSSNSSGTVEVEVVVTVLVQSSTLVLMI